MMYRPLEILPPRAALPLPQEKPVGPSGWTESDPALLLMTDFRDTAPASIASGKRLGDALIEMHHAATGTLLAMEGERIAGIITLHDIHGPKPVQFLHDTGCHLNCRHGHVTVADVMTPAEQLPAVRLSDLQRSRIGDIRKTFEDSKSTHLMVLDDDASPGLGAICGMIAWERIEREVRRSPTDGALIDTLLEPSPREPLLAY